MESKNDFPPLLSMSTVRGRIDPSNIWNKVDRKRIVGPHNQEFIPIAMRVGLNTSDIHFKFHIRSRPPSLAELFKLDLSTISKEGDWYQVRFRDDEYDDNWPLIDVAHMRVTILNNRGIPGHSRVSFNNKSYILSKLIISLTKIMKFCEIPEKIHPGHVLTVNEEGIVLASGSNIRITKQENSNDLISESNKWWDSQPSSAKSNITGSPHGSE